VLEGGSGAAVAGLEELEVAAHLSGAQGDAERPQGLCQLGGGPGPLLAEQFGQQAGDAVAARLVRGRAGAAAGETRRPLLQEQPQGLAGGVGVAAEVGGDARGRPAGVGQQDHLQAVAGRRRQAGMTQRLELAAGGVVQLSAEHVS
jgi:hypothetical protein